MSDHEQLSILRANLEPNQWPCPTCQGAGYLGADDAWRPCRVCHGTGVVSYDPDDHTIIPY